jgi:regulator of replication initiation timing
VEAVSGFIYGFRREREVKPQETKWCEHGKTNHVYCADCEVNRIGALCREQIEENHKLSLENYALKLQVEEMQNELTDIKALLEAGWNATALRKVISTLQSLKEDKPNGV